MGETRETGTGRLDGLQGGVKEELNEGLSQLQDFVSTTMKTEEETAQGARNQSRLPTPGSPLCPTSTTPRSSSAVPREA